MYVHGTGDHGGRFSWLASQFQAAGFSVFAADWRGNGKSGGPRGYIPSFDTLLDDLDQTIAQVRQRTNRPIVLYGQSFGGLLCLAHEMQRSSKETVALIASSPAIDIAIRPPAWKLMVARTIGQILPKFHLPTGIRMTQLTSDLQAQEAFRVDPLRHGKMCARTFFALLETGEWVRAHGQQLELPTLLMHGDLDTVTDPKATRAFSRSASGCELKIWQGLRHELHQEPEKLKVFEFALQWLNNALVDSKPTDSKTG